MADTRQSSRERDAQRNARQMMVDGVFWRVFELAPTPYDRRQSPSLVFESDTAFRRVRNYPASWRALSDDDLFLLSWEV